MVVGLRKIVAVSEKILLSISAFFMFVIIASITAGVISRKVFQSPYSWTEELCTFVFVGMSFFGAAIAASKRKHIAVDYFTAKIPEKSKHTINVVIHFLILFFLGLIIVGAIILQPSLSRFTSAALKIPKNLYYVPIAIAGAHMFLLYLADLIDMLTPERKNV